MDASPRVSPLRQRMIDDMRMRKLSEKTQTTAVALTTIYFLLAAGEFSRWHRVVSDEIWHYHEGDAIELLLFDDKGFRRQRLGLVSGETQPTVVVGAGTWQAARTTGAYTLVACTVGPGFEFSDFSLVVDQPEIAARIASAGPDLARFI